MRKLLFIFLYLFIGCSSPKNKNPHLEIQTKFGNIEVELYPGPAPQSVAAFLSYVDSGYYENSLFYRVLNMNNQDSYAPKAELIQGGLYRSKTRITSNFKLQRTFIKSMASLFFVTEK